MTPVVDALELGRAYATAARHDVDELAATSLGESISNAHEVSRQRWGVALEPIRFAEHLGTNIGEGEALTDALERLHTTDLYLACACTLGRSDAIRAFEQEYMPTLPAMVSRVGAPSALVDEVRQDLLPRLMVGPEGQPPRIASYSGRGALAGWLKVVAIRATLARLERRGTVSTDEELTILSAPGHDPEFDVVRSRHGKAFHEAFRMALGALSERDRRILRAHLVERLTVDQIGDIEGVHRSTAARWLVRIRERIRQATIDDLASRLDIGSEECASLVRVLKSQLAVTIAPHLATRTPETEPS